MKERQKERTHCLLIRQGAWPDLWVHEDNVCAWTSRTAEDCVWVSSVDSDRLLDMEGVQGLSRRPVEL